MGTLTGSGSNEHASSISWISDKASSQRTLPQIEDLTKMIGQYGFDKMPEEANSALQGILQPLIEKLQAAIETASQIPGVKAILEPAVNALMQSVSAYTQTS